MMSEFGVIMLVLLIITSGLGPVMFWFWCIICLYSNNVDFFRNIVWFWNDNVCFGLKMLDFSAITFFFLVGDVWF